jgi:subfamily B ATP-binding cassette protein HlyB/CyaB
MERGQVAELGSHDALLKRPGGIYAHLYSLQQGTHGSATGDAT